jgi:hypothetical protein
MNSYAALADLSVDWEPSAPSTLKQNSSALGTRQLPSVREVVYERNALLLNALATALHEAGGAGGPISENAFNDLPRLLSLLPSGLPAAEASVLPSGSISFDWDIDPENQLSIILVGGNRVGFAACFGGDRVYGTARMGDRLSDEVAAAVAKWLRRNDLDYDIAA